MIEFKGNVVEMEIADAQNEMIDASQKVPKNYNEVVVMGYKKEKHRDGNNRSVISITGSENPYIVLDGKEINKEELNNLKLGNIESISILKGKSATEKHGEKGKIGVLEISTKKSIEK